MNMLKLTFMCCAMFLGGCTTYSGSDQKDFPIEEPKPAEYVVVVGAVEVSGAVMYHDTASSFNIRYQFSDDMPRPVKGIVKFQNPADKSKWLEKTFIVSENDPNQLLITQALPCIDKFENYQIILTIYNGDNELYTLKSFGRVLWQEEDNIPKQCRPITKKI